MGLTTETVHYGEGFTGYLARPSLAKGPLPGVLVFQEAWGVDDHIEDVTRRFALAGYVALAPDLFSENGKRPEAMTRERMTELLGVVNEHGPAMFGDEAARQKVLATFDEGKRGRVGGSMGALFAQFGKLAAHVPAAVAAARYLRSEQPASRGQKVGAVGYCMGGGLAGMLACHDPELGVSCIYYGSAPSPDHVKDIRCPVYGFYGKNDARLIAGLPAFVESMKAAGKSLETHVYEGAEHAFFNDERPSYGAAASRDAFARTLEAFRQHL